MEQFYVRVTGEMDFWIIADGLEDFCARCSDVGNGKYLFEYRYFAYTEGGSNNAKKFRDIIDYINFFGLLFSIFDCYGAE